MKISLNRHSLELEAETMLELAFLEDTLGLKHPNALLRLAGRTSYADGRHTISLEGWNHSHDEDEPESTQESSEPL